MDRRIIDLVKVAAEPSANKGAKELGTKAAKSK